MFVNSYYIGVGIGLGLDFLRCNGLNFMLAFNQRSSKSTRWSKFIQSVIFVTIRYPSTKSRDKRRTFAIFRKCIIYQPIMCIVQ